MSDIEDTATLLVDLEKKVLDNEKEIKFLKVIIYTFANKILLSTPKKTVIIPRNKTCRSYLLDLFDKNYFGIERSLSDVKQKLKDTHYDSSTFSHVLKAMVEKRQLKRLGVPRSYLYINDTVGFGSRNMWEVTP